MVGTRRWREPEAGLRGDEMRVAVIGAGVVGALIARELARYDVEIMLFEREAEPGMGVTKANSAIVHAGFHDEPGTLRAKFCVLGNALFPHICEELGVPFRRTGGFVLAFSSQEEQTLLALIERGEINGVPGMRLLSGDEVLAREPLINPEVRRALWAPTVGITSPWVLAQAAVENAVTNGVKVYFGEEVLRIRTHLGRVQALQTTRSLYKVNAVINAAGLYADRVASMAGVPFPPIIPRRGQYIILAANAESLVHFVLFPTPTSVSKGILVLPTIDGGILLGPTAEDLPPEEKEAVQTTREGLSQVLAGALRLIPKLPLNDILKSFAGIRPEPVGGDFVVGPSLVQGFYNAGGMRSPGLTAAPAVARFLVEEVVAPELGLRKKDTFNPFRSPIPRTEELSEEAWANLVRQDGRWGRIVCYCNRVTEAQVIEAIRRGAKTLDGVKFRTGAGFGICQGSFCTARVLEILAQELKVSLDEVTLRGPGSKIVRRRP